MEQIWTTAITCSILALFASIALSSWKNQSQKYPPGPPKLPLLGNLLNMPPGMDYKRFLELGKQYNSDIIHLSALGTSVVILNSYRVARDLLDRKSATYSSRPESVMLHELCHLKMYFVFSAYGDFWRACRRLFTKHLNSGDTSLHRSREIFYIRRFLGQLLDKPDGFRQHIRILVGAISIAMTYGLDTQPENDPNMKMVEAAAEALSTVILAGTYLVDIIPALKHLPPWFPGTGFLKEAEEMGRFNVLLRDSLFNSSVQNTESKSCQPSFVSQSLRDMDHEGSEDEITVLKYTAGQVYAAGSDTTASAIASLFLAMVCYPEVQKRLQEELDTALRDRLPNHEDVDSLPYLNAVAMEVLRWNPVTPIGVPHRVTEDDVYNGYFIPRDSIVIANQAMLHDPQFYPDPFTFKPERFLKEGKIDSTVMNPTDIAFGFGRRICAGNAIALSILRMTAASVLFTFELRKAIDSDGKLIEPTQEYEETFLSHPKEFACVIKPRSPQAEEMIRSWTMLEDQDR